MKKLMVVVTLCIYSSWSYAFFCPNNFKDINLGATTDQVTQQCGAPDAINKLPPNQNGPKEWTYFIKLRPTGSNAGSFKMTITFVNESAINISVNGLGMSSTSICGDSITIGSTAQRIQAACGKPTTITQAPDDKSADVGQEFVYNSSPKVIFVFENNKMVLKK